MALLAEPLQSLKHPVCGTSFCPGLAVLIRSMDSVAKRAVSLKVIAQFRRVIALLPESVLLWVSRSICSWGQCLLHFIVKVIYERDRYPNQTKT
jgi:hypothetical protein